MYTVKTKEEITKYINNENLIPYGFNLDNYKDIVFGTKLTFSQSKLLETNRAINISRKSNAYTIYHFMVKREIANKIREYV